MKQEPSCPPSTTCPRSNCSARSASRSIRRLGLVSQEHRLRQVPHRGQLVADGNGGILITRFRGDLDESPARRAAVMASTGGDGAGRQGFAEGQQRPVVHSQAVPGMLRGIYGMSSAIAPSIVGNRGVYFTGDGARFDEDGYFWITGRVDDVIKVSGHRLGTAESSRHSFPIRSCGSRGGRYPDELTGEAILRIRHAQGRGAPVMISRRAQEARYGAGGAIARRRTSLRRALRRPAAEDHAAPAARVGDEGPRRGDITTLEDLATIATLHEKDEG